jgi:hypothetical protein
MKLRLFGGCAAAYFLAGTLCVSAQDADPKVKGGRPDAGPSTESRGSSGGPQQKESSEKSGSRAADGASDGSKANRADRQTGQKESGAREDRVGNDGPPMKKGRADTAADKSDKGPSTSNAATQDTKASRERSAEHESEGKLEPSAASKQEKGTADDKGAKNVHASARSERAGKNVQLSADKRDRVQSSFRSDLKLKRETKVDVNISIGSRAPRSWAFVRVPTTVVEVVPEYRGYVVAYVENEYVICHPDTYEIVAVLPASSSDSLAATGRSTGEAGAGEKCSSSLTLTETDKIAILKEVDLTDEVGISGVTVGWSVPSEVELKPLPRSIVDRSDELGACRYFIIDEQVAIVDPDEDKVVLLIDRK